MYSTSVAMGHVGVYTITNCGNVSCLPSVYIDEDIARRSQLYEMNSSIGKLNNLVGETAVSAQIDTAIKNVTPNWNAVEGENGHILNRTHYKIDIDFNCSSYTWNTAETVPDSSLAYVAYVGSFKIDKDAYDMINGNLYYDLLNLFGANYKNVKFGETYKSISGPSMAFCLNETAIYNADDNTYTLDLNMYSSSSPGFHSESPTITNVVAVAILEDVYIPDTIARIDAVPTRISELTNDSGFVTNNDLNTEIDNLTPAQIGAASKEELAVERNRIDQFVALKDGSTTGDAELKDIRVGYHGALYATAGEAVRQQIGEVANAVFKDIETEASYNVFNPNAAEAYTIGSTSGFVSEVIPCAVGDVIYGRFENADGSLGTLQQFGVYLIATNGASVLTSTNLWGKYTVPTHASIPELQGVKVWVRESEVPYDNRSSVMVTVNNEPTEFEAWKEVTTLKVSLIEDYRDELQEQIYDLQEQVENLQSEGTGNAVQYTVQNLTEEQKAQARANIGLNHYVTPQMYGAVADGVADDTIAVQTALDAGSIVYFPAGRYKVTRQLTVSKSCRIEMFKPYPATYQGEYPLTADDNWMGARIETYATDGIGILIGDAVEVDGLFLRAMDGFTGVLLKLDTTIGTYTYQTSVRLSHIKLENDSSSTIPESMFDFTPDGSYHYILNDIAIGRSPSHPRCVYGFRADLSGTPRQWCNNVIIRNMCIDMRADYPVYIDGAKCARGWVFDCLTIQAYNFDPGHINLIAMKNIGETLFLGCYLWDLVAESILNGVFFTENVTNTTCVSCSDAFDAIETGLSDKMKQPENLNITNLAMTVNGDEETGGNILTLSDGAHKRNVTIPAATLSDEQINGAISSWMDENAKPKEVIGRNKFDSTSAENIKGYYYANPNNTVPDTTNGDTMWMTHLIEASVGDIIRVSINGVASQAWGLYCYDKNKNRLGSYSVYAGNGDGIDPLAIEVLPGATHTTVGYMDFTNTKYIRFSMSSNLPNGVPFSERENSKICITVNNTDISYEEYGIRLEGGLANSFILQSPNGNRYTIAVTNDGELIAKPL